MRIILAACKSRLAILQIVLLLVAAVEPARAGQTHQPEASSGGFISGCIGYCNGGRDVAIAAVVVGAVVGVGLYFLLRKGPSIAGCVAPGGNGFQLKDETDQRAYTLTGKTAAIRAGEHVRVYGKKRGKASPEFLVKKRPKDLGVCTAAPATP